MTITPNPSVTALPAAPARLTDTPAAFVTKADAMMAALPTFAAQLSAVGAVAVLNGTAAETAATEAEAAQVAAEAAQVAAVGVSTLMATCATSVTLSLAAKALTLVETGRTFANGQRVSLIRISDPTSFGTGLVSAANMGARTMTVTLDVINGATGPFTDWLVILTPLAALPAATAAQVKAGTASTIAVTPAGLVAASAFQVLTAGASIAWDFALGVNARVTLGAAANAFAAPTNLFDGAPVSLFIAQDGTGGRTATFNAIFDWGVPGVPTLSTGANKVDQVFGIYSAFTGKIHATFRPSA